MGKHEKFEHPDVVGETDPKKIKRKYDAIKRSEEMRRGELLDRPITK